MRAVDNETNTIPVGTEVIAVRNGDEATKTIFYFGEGVYKGDEVPAHFHDAITDPESALHKEARRVIEAEDAAQVAVQAAFTMVDKLVADGMPATHAALLKQQILAEDAAVRAQPIEERVREALERTGTNPRIDLYNGQTVWGYQCWWGPADDMRETFSAYTWELVEVGA